MNTGRNSARNKSDTPPPGLRRLAQYLDRVWSFRGLVGILRDGRKNPSVPLSSVFLAFFGGLAIRLGSLNQLEQQLIIPGRWDRWAGGKKPSADTIGYALESISLSSLRVILWRVAVLCKRKKIFERLFSDIHWVAALDGIETYKSREKSCCGDCLTRRVAVGDEYVTEYYHRYVVLQLVGVKPAVFLDVEALKPGETETAAGSRLLKRFLGRHHRYLDAITMDAFYLQAPFLKELVKFGVHLLVVLKQENRELYQDAMGLCAGTPAVVTEADGLKRQLWDFDGLRTWAGMPRGVRVIRSLETRLSGKRGGDGEMAFQQETKDWMWCLISPPGCGKPAAGLAARWGHARWDEETRGFGELTQHWHLNHCYKHGANAMLAALMILFLAFTLTTIFFLRNLKGVWRKMSRVALSRLLADDLALPYDGSFWSPVPG